MRRVLIATPTYNGQVYAAFTHALAQTVRINLEKGLGYDIRDYYPRGKVIHEARNDCVAQAMRNDFDDLIWIDADQDWQPEWFFELLAYPVDCVGAAVRKKTDETEVYNVYCPNGPGSIVSDPATGLWTADGMAVGCGFLRMSRKAMQRLWNASQPCLDAAGEELRWIYDYTIFDGRVVGEDTIACIGLRALGIPTWLAPHMNPGHHDGMKRYVGDFADWLARTRPAAA